MSTEFRKGTIGAKMIELLVNNGLWPNDAATVLDRVIALDLSRGVRWNDVMEGYPKQLLVPLWNACKNETVRWIDECCPQHFARPMFTGE